MSEKPTKVEIGQRWKHKTCGCILIPSGGFQDPPYQHIPACELVGCAQSSYTLHTGIDEAWATLLAAPAPIEREPAPELPCRSFACQVAPPTQKSCTGHVDWCPYWLHWQRRNHPNEVPAKYRQDVEVLCCNYTGTPDGKPCPLPHGHKPGHPPSIEPGPLYADAWSACVAAQAQQGAGPVRLAGLTRETWPKAEPPILLPAIGSRWEFETFRDGAWKSNATVLTVIRNEGEEIEFDTGSLPLAFFGPEGSKREGTGSRHRVVPAKPRCSWSNCKAAPTTRVFLDGGFSLVCVEHMLKREEAFARDMLDRDRKLPAQPALPIPETHVMLTGAIWGRRPTPPKPRYTYPEATDEDCLPDA